MKYSIYYAPANQDRYEMFMTATDRQKVLDTYVEVANIELEGEVRKNLEEIFRDFQSEFMSLIMHEHTYLLCKSEKISHMSMSVGDAVLVGDEVWAVDIIGFKKLEK